MVFVRFFWIFLPLSTPLHFLFHRLHGHAESKVLAQHLVLAYQCEENGKEKRESA